jgi:hypothetical protein
MIYVLSGCKRSGKDTCFKILKESWEAQGYRVAQFAFADALREVCAIVFGFTDSDFSDGTRKETVGSPIMGDEWTPRRALQFVGTDLFRLQVNEDVWVRVARHRLQRLITEVDVVVVTDARFTNEIKLCKDLFGSSGGEDGMGGNSCCSIFVARPSLMPRTCPHKSERFMQMMEEKAVQLRKSANSALFLRHELFDYVLFNEDLDGLKRTLADTFPIPPSPLLGFSNNAS